MQQREQSRATREGHEQAWQVLAKKIAALKDTVTCIPPMVEPGSKAGELIIIGSGIETLGFQMGDEQLIASADKVFYCVADPATVAWITQMRPDAYDLYVLYDDEKVRYTTYMQMAEAQLYYVRQGLKVVSVFYGHPGIFVLSTHRAILIARREGYKATMKAGVCALDCLCADLGVDPCHPGMQTHEATDMLIRKRRPDTSLHVVLWQVGLIGEMGYRRNGYLNRHFSVFIDYLQQFYGHDYPVTHYIASRYPTIPSLIETFPLEALHTPDVQIKVNGLSTFYLAPKESTESNEEMACALGLMQPGQRLSKPGGPLRVIGNYGVREMQAFRDFAHFSVPRSYHWQEQTAAATFLLTLRQDLALQDLYARDPATALADPRFAHLSARERSLLLTRDAGSLQIAAKGSFQRSSPNRPLIVALFKQKPLALALLKRVRSRSRTQARAEITNWLEAQGYQVEWETICEDVGYIDRNYLFAWTGVYAEERQQLLITLVGNTRKNEKSIIYVNGDSIKCFTFSKGVLQWKAEQGNPHNGFIRFDSDPRGKRSLVGKIWPADEPSQTRANFTAPEIDPQRTYLSRFAQALHQSSALSSVAGTYTLRVSEGNISRLHQLVLTDCSLTINGWVVQEVCFELGKLTWQGGPEGLYEGALTFLLDPLTMTPEIIGAVRNQQDEGDKSCYGSGLASVDQTVARPTLTLPTWAHGYLEAIIRPYQPGGGLFLWQQWEKHNLTSLIVERVLVALS